MRTLTDSELDLVSAAGRNGRNGHNGHGRKSIDVDIGVIVVNLAPVNNQVNVGDDAVVIIDQRELAAA